MQLTVMAPAEGNGELIAHLETNGSGLRKAQVMRVRRLAAADETGLCGHELEVRLVAQPLGLSEGKKASRSERDDNQLRRTLRLTASGRLEERPKAPD